MRRYRMDLHVHSCLSPCASDEMTPKGIVRAARERGLDAIGLCDHNSCENVRAVRRAGERESIAVLGGMEITTREEVHVLALFDDDEKLQALQSIIYENLPGTNAPEAFGDQVIMNERDEVTGASDRLLIGATGLSIERVVEATHDLSGIAIASHVDREGFGIFGQLGFIPPGLPLDALEISPRTTFEEASRAYPLSPFCVITSSDAHYPHEIGLGSTEFDLEAPTLGELRKALAGEEGRRVVRP